MAKRPIGRLRTSQVVVSESMTQRAVDSVGSDDPLGDIVQWLKLSWATLDIQPGNFGRIRRFIDVPISNPPDVVEWHTMEVHVIATPHTKGTIYRAALVTPEEADIIVRNARSGTTNIEGVSTFHPVKMLWNAVQTERQHAAATRRRRTAERRAQLRATSKWQPT